MNIPIDSGRSVTVSRSRDGKILVIQREDGTQLIQLEGDAGCEMILNHSPESVWISVLETSECERFWISESYERLSYDQNKWPYKSPADESPP